MTRLGSYYDETVDRKVVMYTCDACGNFSELYEDHAGLCPMCGCGEGYLKAPRAPYIPEVEEEEFG